MPGFRPLAAVSPATPQASDLVVFDAIPQVPRAARVRLTIPRPAALPFGAPAPVSAAKAEFETWRAERHNMTIECAGPVLNEIRIAAVDGYQRMRHGGIEVGGVLFGTHRNGVVQVQAMRPIACEYSQGPRFILSERDQAALAEQLETSRHDLELQGLEPVGWYHSHTRSEVLLSGAEVEYFNRFFPQPWQVALVVRPANLSPVRAGYFFREANGVLRTEASYSEFQLLAPVPAAVAAAA
jgi:proteasome lid subunit RPN8/RPN11